MKIPRRPIGWLIAMAVLLLKACCRVRLHNDPRPMLRLNCQPYAYSVLHAHQISAVMFGERGTGAMVSRSAEGNLLIPSLIVRGIIPVRGSQTKNGGDKGGLKALDSLIAHVNGGAPAYLAVDGPRGPRNRVHKGIAVLSQRTGAAVVNVVAVPKRRWFLSRAWDRLQIPQPFTTIDAYFSELIYPREGEGMDQYRKRIETSLNELEQEHDPIESDRARGGTRKRMHNAA